MLLLSNSYGSMDNTSIIRKLIAPWGGCLMPWINLEIQLFMRRFQSTASDIPTAIAQLLCLC
jgi:hypothetical protein